MKKRLIPVIVLLVAGAATAVYLVTRKADDDPSRLFLSGTIEAREVEVAFNQAGLVEAVLADEGDQVAPGQELARLDSKRLKESLAEAVAGWEAAKAAISLLDVTIRETEETTQAGLGRAQANLVQARSRLDQVRASLNKAQVQNDYAEKEWVRIKALHQQGSTSTSQRDSAKAALDSAASAVKEAQAGYAQAQAALQLAQADLALAQAQTIAVERLRQQKEQTRLQAVQAQAKVGVLEQTIRETVIHAPLGGRVISRNVEPGEAVSPGTGILTLTDLDHLWLRAYVPETDLGRVKLGQEVEVKTDTYPGKAYQGRVAHINDKAEFTPKAVQTKEERIKLVFRIKVDLDNPSQELKPGMPADAWIKVGAR